MTNLGTIITSDITSWLEVFIVYLTIVCIPCFTLAPLRKQSLLHENKIDLFPDFLLNFSDKSDVSIEFMLSLVT